MKILFTRQRHDADRAGLHWDYRIVIGDKAYSWATKKDMPEPGKAIILWEQPVHTADYALRKRIVIPKGQYGSGITTLDYVKKGDIKSDPSGDKHVITLSGSDKTRLLLKKLPNSAKGDAWLFKNLGPEMNKYIEKVAAELQSHQNRALNKLNKPGTDGIILDHSTGSGKTLTMLTAVERMHKTDKQGEALIVAPASLVTNLDKEIEKHKLKIDRKRLTALSYEKAVNQYDDLKNKKYALAIADEAHKLRSTGSKRHEALSEIFSNSDKRILATATTTYNHASDIAPLVNIAAGYKALPEGKKDFEEAFVHKPELQKQPPLLRRIFGGKTKEVSQLKNSRELSHVLNKYVDKYDLREDPAAAKLFPQKHERTIEVEMDKHQERTYRYLEDKLPWHLKMKVRMNLPLDKKDRSSLNSFSTGIRQASNSIKPFHEGDTPSSPKVQKAVERLHHMSKTDKNFRGVVYSNFLGGGLHDYSKELHNRGIEHTVYHGGLKPSEKDQAVSDYNTGKKPVLLVSSSGAEGLDLKGTKLIQVLEPHFNKSKIQQVIGRGVRYKSHEHLPEDERRVEVEHYHSIFPGGVLGKSKVTSIDQYLHHHSEDKDTLNNDVRRLITNDK